MKKSKSIILGGILFFAISSCQQRQDDWVSGADASGKTRDTSIRNGNGYAYYRYYGGYWYPLYHNMISPSTYNGATSSDIVRPSFSPTRSQGFRSGGFGSSSRTSGGVRSGGFGSSSHGSIGS
jgi:hypothetical protein